jgi:hypothetical protein
LEVNVQFKVVPFRGRIKANELPDVASQQLQEVINAHVKQGWVFHSLGQIHTIVQPGCVAGLLGASASVVVYDQVIFHGSKE